MRRKEVILFMTVGTGINQGSEEEGYKSMANKLYSSINRIFPNFVVFFATEKSKETIKYIEELFKMENDIFVEDEDYEIKYIEEIDDFNHCFEIIEIIKISIKSMISLQL